MGRKSAGAPRQQKIPRPIYGQLKEGVLAELFAGTGITGYPRRAEHLGVSTTTLWRADQGYAIGIDIALRILHKFPHVKFEDAFTVGVSPRVPAAKQAA